MSASTPSQRQLRAGLVVELEAGDAVTLHPSPGTRTIVVKVLEKSGRRARLRVQGHEVVQVSTPDESPAPAVFPA